MRCIVSKKLLTIIILVFFANICLAADGERITCTGKVINSESVPLESVKVGFYEISLSPEDTSYEITLAEEVQTDKDGKFEYEIDKETTKETQVMIIYAQKEGYGLGWTNWQMNSSVNFDIKLYPSAPVGGIVVDESDKPIADANVSLAFLMVEIGGQPQMAIGEVLPGKLTTKTDEQGKFAFDNIPENAKFDIRVKKAGRASTVTMDLKEFQRNQILSFSAGQTDIKIVQPPEAQIKGIVVEKTTGKPVSGVRISLGQGTETSFLYGIKPITSSDDGTFSFDSLPEIETSLIPINQNDGASEWLINPVEVTTKAGQTISDIKIELSKGGILEVLVKDEKSKQPANGVSVLLQLPDGTVNGFPGSNGARTNAEGIASFHLPEGQYIIAQTYSESYKQANPGKLVSVENGYTRHFELSLEPYGKMTGTVLDENNKPVANAIVFINPPMTSDTKTDENGKFVLQENRSGYYDDGGIPYIIIRDKEHNLAGAYELYDKEKEIEIKLSKGITVSGKVTDSNDNAIGNTKISVVFITSNIGVIKEEKNAADNQGNFTIYALPEGINYSVYAEADGYGRETVSLQGTQNSGDILELDPIVLKYANMSVSGIVVDIDGKPVANADIYGSGSGQPNQRAKTDNEGKFTLEKVCAGRISISAQSQINNEKFLYGSAQAEVGKNDIQIIISENGSARIVQPRPVSQIGKPLQDMNNLLNDFNPETNKGKSVLICFWDYEQRPSRNCIMQLNKRVEELKEKGIEIIAIQASEIEREYLDEWLEEYNVNFPVGMIKDNPSTSLGTGEEKTRVNWGVKALPWLILTDKEHVVIAEGFTVAELDEHI